MGEVIRPSIKATAEAVFCMSNSFLLIIRRLKIGAAETECLSLNAKECLRSSEKLFWHFIRVMKVKLLALPPPIFASNYFISYKYYD